MKSASTKLPDQPVNGVTAGVDRACDDHAVAVVDSLGCEISRHRIEHSAAGLKALLGLLGRYRVAEVAIERPDGPVVDALLGAGITVVVISPNQVKNLRVAMTRRATRTTGLTRSCWPTRCGLTGLGWSR